MPRKLQGTKHASSKKRKVSPTITKFTSEVIDRIVPDTSAIINKIVSSLFERGKLAFKELILHRAMLAELEYQANQGRESGDIGLEEVKALTDLGEKGKFLIKFEGGRPNQGQIKYAKLGEIDAMIRELAWDFEATLITSDKVQAKVAESIGMKVIFVPYETKPKELSFVKYFKNTYMSIHIKENEKVLAKEGKPGDWKFVEASNKKLDRADLERMTDEIVEATHNEEDAFLEIERPGSIIAQIKDFRIVVTRPPFANSWEITVVRPVKQLKLSDYELSEKLQERLASRAEGILIAGAPGQGKTTFASALAVFYASSGKVVKTLEAPRDLQLPNSITQFAITNATPQEINDVLLLTRPDYTIFDEMRNTGDFRMYADLRLAGVGMVGVIHATKPIDAIQRFIGRIELGMVSHVVDTVIFIKGGRADKVLEMKASVKVPSGMAEADLARPIIEVRDFESGKPEYEIYSYGEETVVMPVQTKEKTEFDVLLEDTIRANLQKRLKIDNMEIEMTGEKQFAVYVPEREIPRVIGTGGERVMALEKMFGVSLDIRPLGRAHTSSNQEALRYELREAKKYFEFFFNKPVKSVYLDIGGQSAGSMPVGQSGSIRVHKKSRMGRDIIEAFSKGKKIDFKTV